MDWDCNLNGGEDCNIMKTNEFMPFVVLLDMNLPQTANLNDYIVPEFYRATYD